jgi:anti-anti-sigma factor
VVWVGRVAVIKLPAEVDVSNADQIRQDLIAAVAQDASLVIADMSATTFCDSAGVTALVRAVRKANASGAGLRVATSAPAVTRVLSSAFCHSVRLSITSAPGSRIIVLLPFHPPVAFQDPYPEDRIETAVRW